MNLRRLEILEVVELRKHDYPLQGLRCDPLDVELGHADVTFFVAVKTAIPLM